MNENLIKIAVGNAIIANLSSKNLILLGGGTDKTQARIYSEHVITSSNPIYPAISHCRIGGGFDSHLISSIAEFQITVWSMNGTTELSQIYDDIVGHDYNGLTGALTKDNLNAAITAAGYDYPEFLLCKELYVNDSEFDKEINKFWLTSRWKIIYK